MPCLGLPEPSYHTATCDLPRRKGTLNNLGFRVGERSREPGAWHHGLLRCAFAGLKSEMEHEPTTIRCLCKHPHTCTHIYIYTYLDICMCVYVLVRVYLYICLHTYKCNVYHKKQINRYIRIYLYIYSKSCTYTHTRTDCCVLRCRVWAFGVGD